MFKWFTKSKKNTVKVKKEEMNKLVEEFIFSYNSNDTYYKVSYYDASCGIWKETNPIYNTKQEAQDAANAVLGNCKLIKRDLIKVKSFEF